jgi:hypothetical protein
LLNGRLSSCVFFHLIDVTFVKHTAMKKIVLFAAASMLATATLVYATVDKNVPAKETGKKEMEKKELKEKKKSCNGSYHCIL